jgi:hypothetical protein
MMSKKGFAHYYNIFKYDVALPFFSKQLAPAFLNHVRWWWRRSTWQVHSETQALLDAGTPVILAIWHGQMFTLVHPQWMKGVSESAQTLPPYVLISQSRDGDFIANVAKHIGFPHNIRGAHGRGGSKAVVEIQALFTEKKGHLICLMDGPRGPKHEAKKGIVNLAHQLGVPIIPVAGVTPHHWFKFYSAWDDFEIPSMFAQVHVDLGKPIWVEASADEDEGVLAKVNETLVSHLKTTLSRCANNPQNRL